MKNLKIDLKRTPAQLDLIKKLGSKNKTESLAAAEAIAAVIAQSALQVIEQDAVISSLFALQTYDEGAPATIQLDPYFDVKARNFVNVWAQTQPGGTATNFVQGLVELFVHTFNITSAISMNKNALRAARLDYLAASMSKIMQEVLVVQEANAADTLMSSLAGARIDGTAGSNASSNLVITRSKTAGVFQLDDLNTIITAYDRVLASWVGGTPVGQRGSVTDLLGSPEWMGQIRSMAYQPVNTRNGATTTSGASSIAAPDSLREEIFRAAGIPTIYNINLHKVYELGVNRAYNTLFSTYLGSQVVVGNGGGADAVMGASEQVVVGLNANMFDLIRLREIGGDGEFSLTPDDTFTVRSDKVGFFGGVKEGYVSVDGRAKQAILY